MQLVVKQLQRNSPDSKVENLLPERKVIAKTWPSTFDRIIVPNSLATDVENQVEQDINYVC